MDFGPTGGIGRPRLRQVELRRDGPMHGRRVRWLIGDIVGTDDDLAIGHLAQGPGILAGDPDRTAPLLGEPGVIQDQETLGRTLRHEGPHALLVEGLRLPGRIGQEMLQAFGRRPRHRGGDSITVLARQVGEQPREVALHARPAGRATEQGREGYQVGGELRQGLGTGFWDNGCCLHKGYYGFHVSKREYGKSLYENKYTTKLTK